MLEKSEKIIYIQLHSSVLKKSFDETIPIFNQKLNDVQYSFYDSIKSNSNYPKYFICDYDSITKILENHDSNEIKKVYLLSNQPYEKNINIEIINQEFPFNVIKFLEYVRQDLLQNMKKENQIITLNKFSYDESSRNLFNDSISLRFTEKENEIFNFLLSSEGCVNKKSLLQNIWKYNEAIDTHTLETHIYSLRKKLEDKLAVINILEHKDDGYFLNKDLL